MTEQNKLREVTIDYSDDGLGVSKFKAEVLYHLHDLDGSEIILLKSPRRKAVDDFLHNELCLTNKKKYD